MKLSKKLLSILLALLMLLSLTACGMSGEEIDEMVGLAEDIIDIVTDESGGYDTYEEPDWSYDTVPDTEPESEPEPAIDEYGTYDSKEDVALYLITYGHLPYNYITKDEARDLGWDGGSVEQVAPGKCIGGDRFGNYEGLLPEKQGRYYYECDIDTLDYHSRGSRRIVYSNDGLIYYSGDHYKTFELLYGEVD